MNKAAFSVICIIYSFYRSFDPVIPKLININTALIYSESTPHRNGTDPRPRSLQQMRDFQQYAIINFHTKWSQESYNHLKNKILEDHNFIKYLSR